jgi:TPR repeat protein
MKESVKWYRKAAAQGFLPAKEALKKIEKKQIDKNK